MKAITTPVMLQQGGNAQPRRRRQQCLGTGAIAGGWQEDGCSTQGHFTWESFALPCELPLCCSWTARPPQSCETDSSLPHTCATTRSYRKDVQVWKNRPV